jgi:hypothetical protein
MPVYPASRQQESSASRNEQVMPDNNKRKKSNKKDCQLVIRINRKNRDTFIDLCEEMDTSAAREIRSFIQGFINQHNDKAK